MGCKCGYGQGCGLCRPPARPKFACRDKLDWVTRQGDPVKPGSTFTVVEILAPGARMYGSAAFETFSYVGLLELPGTPPRVKIFGENVLSRDRWEPFTSPNYRVRDGQIERKVQ